MSEVKECKYPMQCASVVRNQTLGIEAKLYKADVKNGDSPLELYNGFSRFPVVLINKEKQATTANISVNDMQMLLQRSDFAMQKHMEREFSPVSVDSGSEPLPIAYTTRMTAGEFKGKTPAEVMIADPATGGNKLNQHYKWLKDNLSKYPNNKNIMDAIVDAGRLSKEGKLEAKTVSSSTFTLLDTGMRPLIRKTDAKGNAFVYEIKITWIFGNNYPIQVEIANYYAPVTKDDKGLLNVQKKQMDRSTLIQNKMPLGVAEWNSVVEGVKRSMRIFEMVNGPVALQEALQMEQTNRTKYTGQQNQNNQGSSAQVTQFPQQNQPAQQQNTPPDNFYDLNSFQDGAATFYQ